MRRTPTTVVHRVWAESLWSLGDGPAGRERIEDELEAARAAIESVPELRLLARSRAVKLEKKKAVLRQVFAERVSPLFLNFLCLATDKGRLAELAGIHQAYVDLHDREAGRVRVWVAGAVELDEDLTGRIRDELARALGKEVLLETEVQPALLGGLLIDFGDTHIDGTVLRRLSSFRRTIKEKIRGPKA